MKMSSAPQWKPSGPGNSSANHNPTTKTSELKYKLSGPDVHRRQTWRFTNPNPNSGDVVFFWDFSGFHAWCQAYIKITLEMTKSSGTTETVVLMEGRRRGTITGKGQETVSLKGCTSYSFVIQGSNYDSDMRLKGTLSVKEVDELPPCWETNGPGTIKVDYDDATETTALSYKLKGQKVHSLQTWRYTNTSPGDDDVIFDWDFSGFHAWYRAYIKISLELKKSNGEVDTIALMEGIKRGNITGSGETPVDLEKYSEYAFVIQGKNFDSDKRLNGALGFKLLKGKGIEWDAEGPGKVFGVYNPKNETSGLSYKLNGEAVCNINTWRYTNKNVDGGEAVFDWDFRGFHGWEVKSIRVVLECKKQDGSVDTSILMDGWKRGNIHGSGQEAVDLNDITSYSFVIIGEGSGSRMFGSLRVKLL